MFTMCTTFNRIPSRATISYKMRTSVKGPALSNLLRQANCSLRILKVIWEAVQMACSTVAKNQDIDNAFESLSDLLRDHSNKGVTISIEGYVGVLHSVCDSPIKFVQPRTGQTKR